MDKKNTMLLTVIAVATLLVAVVGATFAYFSVTKPSDAVTNVSANAGQIGAVNLTNDEGPFKLKVTAEDMKQAGKDEKYYVVKEGEASEDITTDGIYSKDAKDITLATIQLTGAADGDTVKCDISVRADISGTMAGNLKTGDLLMTLNGGDYDGFSGVTEFDFAQQISEPKVTYQGSLADSMSGTVTFTGSKTIDLTNNASKTIKAQIWLVNSNTRDQQELAGKDLSIQFTTSVANCTTVSPKAGD